MKIVSLLALLLCAPAGSFARETAYQALRALGSDRGHDVLNHVINVQGRGGAPQPGAWKVVLDDPAARGGVRELEVADGKVRSERTPLNPGPAAGEIMDFKKLNLDSEGAFTILEKEAQKAHVGFDGVDFELRSGAAGRSPVWVLQLLDAARRPIGTMQIAADTGAIVRSDLFGRKGNERVVEDVPVEQAPPERADDRVARDDEADSTDDGRPRLRVGHRINKAIHQAGAELEEFFTGKRTIDRKYRDEEER